MKKLFKPAALFLFMALLLFSAAACDIGGETMADATAWAAAFKNTFAETDKPDGNMKISVKASLKTVSGDNVATTTSKASIIYADGKFKIGDTYYERVTTTEWGYTYTNWNVYTKNAQGDYQKNVSSYGPSISSILSESGITSMDLEHEFRFFDYQGGKYILNLDRMIEEYGNEITGYFNKDKDKMDIAVAFKGGKISKLSLYMKIHYTGNETKADITFRFGGARVTLPAV